MQKYFIIDFDSTFIQAETLDVISEIVLKNHPEKEAMAKQIAVITNQGMNGEISFDKSLQKRLTLLPITKKDIGEAMKG